MQTNIAVIGLSSFGYYLCKNLSKAGVHVIAIDHNENRVESVKSFVKKAIIADAKDKEVLRRFALNEFDSVVVSVGEKLDTSVLVTLHLRELGVKDIIAKATTTEQAKILSIIGASSIVFPERDIAEKIAHTLRRSNLLDYISLGGEYSVIELAPPVPWLGKSLAELDVRKKYNVQIVMIRELIPEKITIIPGGEHIVKDSDILIILGKNENLLQVEKL